MEFAKHFRNFLISNSGAVTVDWVVLTASIVVISTAVILIITSGINHGANTIDDTVVRYGEAKLNIEDGVPSP